jgi:succinyl-CoA synthetase alpha subunit
MAIYLTKESKVLVQGMTGGEGMKHTRRMLAAGTNVVGGVNPRKAGRTVDFDVPQSLNGLGGAPTAVPVFGSVAEGMDATGADVTVVFVPPAFAKYAVVEAADAGIGLAVVITEGIPVHDSVAFIAHAQRKGTRVIGPNCPGLITPGQSNAGIIPADIAEPGRIGLVSKSGTLTYQLMYELRDIGFSTCVGIGGDPVVGTTHIDCGARRDPGPGRGTTAGQLPGVPAHALTHVTARTRTVHPRPPPPKGRKTQVKGTAKPWYGCPCRRGGAPRRGGRHLVRVAEWQTR